MAPAGISIIIPTYNEAGNIRKLFARLENAMRELSIPCEVIVIDDHSTDNTEALVKEFARDCPIHFYTKKGQKGKGFSIMEGFTYAHYEYVCMLDADLQYPPELIPELYHSAQIHGFAVANRRTYKSTLLRRFASRFNAFVFGRLLLNLRTDVQSGLKLFPRDVFERIDPKLVSAWGLDIPLVFTAYELGYLPGHVDMDFHPREEGESKIKFLGTTLEIVTGAIKTKLYHKPFRVLSDDDDSMIGSGFSYKRKRFTTHTTLATNESAITTFSFWQGSFIGLVVLGILYSMIRNPLATAIATTATLSAIYFTDVLFNLFVISKSLHFPPEISIPDEDVATLSDKDLPVYSILCPLYKESKVLPQFVEAMSALEYPKAKLDIMLLLEEDDTVTISEAKRLKLPPYFRIVIVPDSQPKTKPKASNYGLAMAKGEYVVVYDAEDKPEVTQLKKAIIAFQRAEESVVCLQAKLNYYNPTHNILTRLFTAEYSLWFDVILPGLQSINTSIPLGGTSNHFRTADLVRLKGWDPFNVTEDCDLGARLFKAGYKTAVIDSTTLEEANSHVRNWFRQRSRWIKGYMQTYLVHMRNPVSFARDYGWHAMIFQLVVGGKISFMLINPILWLITISYFVLNRYVGSYIEAIYPAAVFYMAAFSLVMGNFICLYTYMIGCARRGHYELIKYVFLVPFYWLMISWSACIAMFQLFFKPHYWEKTIHGLHILAAEENEERSLLRMAKSKARANRFARFADLAKNKVFVGGGILVVASLVGNLLNFLYNAYLSRKASLEDFGLISLIGSFLYLTQVPLNSFGKSVTHKSAYLLGQYNKPVKEFWEFIRKKVYSFSLFIAAVWIGLTPVLMQLFKSSDPLPFLLFTPVWIVGALAAVDGGFLGGNLNFSSLALMGVSEAASKLIFSVLFVEFGYSHFVYAAIPLSMTVSFTIGWLNARRTQRAKIAQQDLPKLLSFPSKFFYTSVLTSFSTITYLSLDVMLAKHYLSPSEAGMYSFLTLAGKMAYFISSLFSQFTIPLISRDMGAGKQSKTLFIKILMLVIGVNVLAYLVFGAFGNITVRLLWGEKSIHILEYLPTYVLAMVVYSVSSLIVTYNQLKGRLAFPIVAFILGLLQSFGIILFHDSILSIVRVITLTSVTSLLILIALDKYYDELRVIAGNIRDFKDLFSKFHTKPPLGLGKKRILIFNWRDLNHQWAGGAEVYIHELAKRWVRMGHQVTLFCGNDGQSKRHEVVDGVKIIRRGGFYFVYVWAFFYYRMRFSGNYDIVIDSENGLPFFTPLYSRVKTFLLIHHVHQEVFRKRLKPPFSWIALTLERYVMPAVYRRTEVITVSPSSKADILVNKLTKTEPYVVYNGVNLKLYKPAKKSKHPSILYLGRLTQLKSLSVLLHAAKRIIDEVPKATFIIAGDGPDRERLMNMTKTLGLEKTVTFLGRVSEPEKIALYQKAWVFVNPSLIEGWGITTIEANACGTPVIASNVAGLRDAVHNPHSGLLVPYGDVDMFAKNIVNVLKTTSQRNRMSREAIKWAKKFDWDKSSNESIEILLK
jgi:cellulose synthase/poly-beta-1,6-N-acetylglucosamine synthase-like glycosyltransferase/glycosyltransferase involved in cell wall biosynthesis/O-antigen/teichoic acid export membrane protein